MIIIKILNIYESRILKIFYLVYIDRLIINLRKNCYVRDLYGINAVKKIRLMIRKRMSVLCLLYIDGMYSNTLITRAYQLFGYSNL